MNFADGGPVLDAMSAEAVVSVEGNGHSVSSSKSRRGGSRRNGHVSQLDSARFLDSPRLTSKISRGKSVLSDRSAAETLYSNSPRSVMPSPFDSSVGTANKDSVKVLVRIRPPSRKEMKEENRLSIQKTSNSSLQLTSDEGLKDFAYDAVIGDEISQAELFQDCGANIVERCLSGYNGCIFAYGQTGSGKTYTMLGDVDLQDGDLSESAGMIPRIFKYLFELLEERRETEKTSRLEIDCKCSFLEIYNETITDLLDPRKKNLPIREGENGPFAAGLTEQKVTSVEDALELINIGASNRSVARTNMNAASSRSHSILTCTLTVRRENENGCSSVFTSRLNLVDLAGSERQKSTGTAGSHLREASGINKSLSALGLVIRTLGDAKSKKLKHVPYRDSKLTFLLQDSLGGNANAVIISNVSPSAMNVNETLSTLRFAERAKMVTNKAVSNHDVVGNVSSLKAEIALLKQELHELKNGTMTRECLATPSDDFVTDFKEVKYSLADALKREGAALRKAAAITTELSALQSTLDTKENELLEQKHIAESKDEEIKRLQETIESQKKRSLHEEYQILRLKEEAEFFKSRTKRASDATRYASENIQLKLELAALNWSLNAGQTKASFDERIAQLRKILLEVKEEFEQHEGPNSEELKATVDASAKRVVRVQTERLQKLMKKPKSRKQKREETFSRYVTSLRQWAKMVSARISRSLGK